MGFELETVDERAKRECQELSFNKSIDKLAELEKLILDKLIKKGYIIGSGDWGFKVEINSTWKQKSLNVLLKDKNGKFSLPSLATSMALSHTEAGSVLDRADTLTYASYGATIGSFVPVVTEKV